MTFTNGRLLTILVMVVCVLGCARAVRIMQPADQATVMVPVQFEVDVRGQNFQATLDGQPITMFFTVSGGTATASSAAPGFPMLLPGGRYLLRTTADLAPQPWQAVDRDDEIEFSIAALPALSIAPVSTSIPINSSSAFSVSIPNGAPAGFSLTVSPQNASLAINGQPAGTPVALQVPSNATGQTFSVTALQAGNTSIQVSGSGYQSANANVSIPVPSIALNVMPNISTVVWGQTASYDIEVQSQNGFSGQVDLQVDQLPAGVVYTLSANTVNLSAANPSQTVSLSLQTGLGGTQLGSSQFRVRTMSSVSSVSQTPTLNVQRIAGAFAKRPHLSAANEICSGAVTANYAPIAVNDIRVTFTVTTTSGSSSTQAIPAIYYVLPGNIQAANCRVGVVMHPCQQAGCTGAGDPALSWYNLGWPAAIGAPALTQQTANITGINWHQFWFSPDQSLLLLVTKMQQAVNCPPTCPYLNVRAFLYDTINGALLGQQDFRTRVSGSVVDPVADISSIALAGQTVTIIFIRENGSQDSRTIVLP